MEVRSRSEYQGEETKKGALKLGRIPGVTWIEWKEAVGLLVGPSSGAAFAACLKLAASIKQGVIATIFPDGGGRYFSTAFHHLG